MQSSGAIPSEKYGVYKTRDIVKEFPEIEKFSEQWSRELGRDVNFVGYPDSTPPARDATEYTLKGQTK